MVYLCHKCGGLLTASDDAALYHCGCMSGYVRDWQDATPASDARDVQIRATLETLKLYAGQKRDPNSGLVVRAKAQLARLQS